MLMDHSDTFRLKGHLIVEIHDAKTGKLKSRDHIDNLIVTTAKESIAKVLRGLVSGGAGQISFCAVGTGTNVPALGDTTLQTELFRKQISVRNSSGPIATFQTFFNQNEAIGVLREAGLFGEGATSTPGSGVLFARLNMNRTKSGQDTMTLTWGITVQ